jgi:hypothetical protein
MSCVLLRLGSGRTVYDHVHGGVSMSVGGEMDMVGEVETGRYLGIWTRYRKGV